MQFCNPHDHIPEAECKNHNIKEICRITYYCLPFNQLPKSLLILLIYTVVAQLNYLAVQHSVSTQLSPGTIIHLEHISYKTHGQFSFGQSIQAYSAIKPINTLGPQTLDCIYIYNQLQTGKMVTFYGILQPMESLRKVKYISYQFLTI